MLRLCAARVIFSVFADRCKLPKLVNFHAFPPILIILTGFILMITQILLQQTIIMFALMLLGLLSLAAA